MANEPFSAQMAEVDNVINSHSEIEQHLTRVRMAYNQGLRLFTKERLHSLKQQIAEYRRTRTPGFVVHVTDLESNHIELPVLSGHVSCPVDGSDRRERVLGDPMIDYQSIQDMLHSPSILNNKDRVALPLRIKYKQITRDSVTKQPVPTMPEAQPTLNATHLGHLLETQRQEFQDGEPWNHLMGLLGLKQHNLSRVKKIVAFACGSLAQSHLDVSSFERSLTQHALLLALRQLLATLGPQQRPMPCFVQDPSYTDVDRQVLADHGIVVLEDPDGFLEVDETALIVSVAATVPIKQIVTDIARPVAMIWGQLRSNDFVDRWCTRVEDMVNTEYNELSLVRHPHYEDMSLLVRRPRDGEEAQDVRDAATDSERRGNSAPNDGQVPGSSATTARP